MPDTGAETILDEARNAIMGGTAQAAVAMAAGTGSALVAVGGLAGALPAFLGMLIGIARTWKENDTRNWWHSVLFADVGDGTTPEEIAGIIDAHKDEPFVRETILRSLRALLDSPDECTVTALAVLAREYIRKQKPPDYFFRGACGMLMSCSRSEFEQVQEIARTVTRLFEDSACGSVSLETGKLREGLLNVVGTTVVGNPVPAVDGPRIIRRLCAEELATEIGMMDKGLQINAAYCKLLRDPGLRFFKLVLA
jgi:hypothetical protein